MNNKTNNGNSGNNQNSGNSDNRKSRPPSKNRNRRNNNNNKNRQDGKTPVAYNKSASNRQGNSRYKGRNNRSKSPLKAAFNKYDFLLETYLNNRKKYFEQYHRGNKDQQKKLERNYHSALYQLRKFEASLDTSIYESLQKRFHSRPKDTEISLKDGEEIIKVGKDQTFGDPHQRVDQQNLDFSKDNQDSTGNMDDYIKYKASS